PGDTAPPPVEDDVPSTTLAPEPTGGSQRQPRELGPSEGLPEEESTASSVVRPLLYVAAGVGGALVLAALLALAVVALKRARRRRRRHAPTAAARVVGAWDEAVDRLVELHFPLAPTMTALDIARASR